MWKALDGEGNLSLDTKRQSHYNPNLIVLLGTDVHSLCELQRPMMAIAWRVIGSASFFLSFLVFSQFNFKTQRRPEKAKPPSGNDLGVLKKRVFWKQVVIPLLDSGIYW